MPCPVRPGAAEAVRSRWFVSDGKTWGLCRLGAGRAGRPGGSWRGRGKGRLGQNGAEWSRIDPQGSQGYSGRCSFSNRAMRNLRKMLLEVDLAWNQDPDLQTEFTVYKQQQQQQHSIDRQQNERRTNE